MTDKKHGRGFPGPTYAESNADIVRFQLLNSNARMPSQAHPTDAGFDLYTLEDVSVGPGEIVDVPTGVAIALPKGCWGRLIGRSSTIRKRGLLVVEGVIDNGYRGELFYVVRNMTKKEAVVKAGERLAQLIVIRGVPVTWRRVDFLDETDRSFRGFGSSGN